MCVMPIEQFVKNTIDCIHWANLTKCALTNYDVIQVKFLLRQSIAASLTSTASLEMVRWEAEGNGET